MIDVEPLHPEFYDLAFKDIFAEKTLLAQFLNAALDPEILRHLDLDHAEPWGSDLSDPLTGKAVADTVWRFPWRGEPDQPPFHVILLLEHQSNPHAYMPLRIFLYIARCLHRYLKGWRSRQIERRKQQKAQGIKRAKPEDVERLKLPVIIPIVFYTGQEPWLTPRGLISLYDYSELLRPFVPDWTTIYWELRKQDFDELRRSPSALLNALSIIQRDPTKADAAEFDLFRESVAAVIKLMVQNQSGLETQALEKLLNLIVGSLIRNCSEPERQRLKSQTDKFFEDHEKLEGRMTTAYHPESFYAKYLRDVAKSRKQGQVQGRVLALRQSLRKLMEKRFGQPLKPEVMERIERCRSASRLDQAIVSVLDLASQDDLDLGASS